MPRAKQEEGNVDLGRGNGKGMHINSIRWEGNGGRQSSTDTRKPCSRNVVSNSVS